MKKSIFLILFLVSFQLFCFGQEFNDIKISTPRMNGKIVEKVQIALNKCSLLPKKEIDGWYGPITEKSVKELQKIIGYEQNGIIDYDLYNLLINPNFQSIVLSEINNSGKSQKEELDQVYDLSGYEICVYRNEKNEIYKYTKAYWRAFSPDYKREIQFIEEYYFINETVHKKLIENPTQNDKKITWTFNISEEINDEIQNLYKIYLKWEINKNKETNKYEIGLFESRNNMTYKIGELFSDKELEISKNDSVRSKRNSISTVSQNDSDSSEGFIIFREDKNLNIYFYFIGNSMESVLQKIKSISITDRDVIEVIE